MDTSKTKIVEILQAITSTDNNARMNGEIEFKKHQTEAGIPSSLLNIACEENSFNEITKHLAIICLKTLVIQNWPDRNKNKNINNDNSITNNNKNININKNVNTYNLGDSEQCPDQDPTLMLTKSDKEYIMTNIFRKLSLNSKNWSLFKIVMNIIIAIGYYELPNWPALFEDLNQGINSQNFYVVFCSFSTIFNLMNISEFKLKRQLTINQFLIQNYFDKMKNFASKIMQMQLETQNAIILKMILKIYFKAIQVNFPTALQTNENFNCFMKIIVDIINLKLSNELEFPTEDGNVINQRKKNEFWKLKKVASYILHLIFQKYCNPKFVDRDLKAFSQNLLSNYSKGILDLTFQVLNKNNQQYFDPIAIHFFMSILTQGINNPFTCPIILAQAPKILNTTIYKCLFATKEELAVYDLDPIEFIKTVFDEEIYENPADAATRFISSLCNNRIISEIAKANNSIPNPDEHPILFELFNFLKFQIESELLKGLDLRNLEASIYCIGILADELLSYNSISLKLNELIFNSLFPCLKNNNGIIRMRSCWTISKLASFNFSSKSLIFDCCMNIMNCLNDTDLQVRVIGIYTLSIFLYNHEISRELKDSLNFILKTNLQIIKEVEIEEAIKALFIIVNNFGKEILPYAKEIIEVLCDQFQNYNFEHEGKDDDDDEDSYSCINTIGTILYCIGDKINIMPEIENNLFPIILNSMSKEGSEKIAGGIEIISRLTYFLNSISPRLWEVYHLMINICFPPIQKNIVESSIGSSGFDYLIPMGVPFSNFISNDPLTFLTGSFQGKGNCERMIILINKTFEISRNTKNNLTEIVGIKLICAIIEALPGKVDHLVPGFVSTLVKLLESTKEDCLISMNLVGIFICIWYNSKLAFEIFEKNNLNQIIFKIFFDHYLKFVHDFELKKIIMGLASILKCDSLPSSIMNNYLYFFKATIILSYENVKLKTENTKDPNIKIIKHDEAEEVNPVSLHQTAMNIEENEEDNEESDNEDEGPDLVISRINNIDELILFKSIIDSMKSSNFEAFSKLVESLIQEDREKLEIILDKADEISKWKQSNSNTLF